MILIVCRLIVFILIEFGKRVKAFYKLETLKQLGLNIQHERKKLSLSQEKLAEKANIHRTYIGMVERGEKNISILSLEKIANALDVSLTKLTENL